MCVLRQQGSTFSHPLCTQSHQLLTILTNKATAVLLLMKQNLQTVSQWKQQLLQFPWQVAGGVAYLWWLAGKAGCCALNTHQQGWLRETWGSALWFICQNAINIYKKWWLCTVHKMSLFHWQFLALFLARAAVSLTTLVTNNLLTNSDSYLVSAILDENFLQKHWRLK